MEMRRLGKTGLSVAPIVIGGNVFGWTADEKTSFAILDAFFDAGLNAIDTADVYSAWVPGNKGGDSEEIIGRWLKQSAVSRDKAVIITKVGSDMGQGKTLKAGVSSCRTATCACDASRHVAFARVVSCERPPPGFGSRGTSAVSS
ncbi:Oxidoreductase protein [Rhizobium phaseoli]|nr:Oxidoreductase protein [Rhizobium phaseoli]